MYWCGIIGVRGGRVKWNQLVYLIARVLVRMRLSHYICTKQEKWQFKPNANCLR